MTLIGIAKSGAKLFQDARLLKEIRLKSSPTAEVQSVRVMFWLRAYIMLVVFRTPCKSTLHWMR